MIKHCFIDLETTGLDPVKHGVIQIAGIIPEGESESTIFNFAVRPHEMKIIEPDALKVNKHTEDEIAGFQSPKEVHDTLCLLFNTYVDKFDRQDKMFFLGYNVRFDYDFLWQWFKDCGDKYFGSWFFNPPIDVMQAAIIHLQDRRAQMENFKLATVAKELGIEVKDEEPHDAMTDIELTKKIWDKVTA